MKYFIALSIFFMTSLVFAHGEDQPGPHGGHIQMPGNFHTELVIQGSVARIYLLDLQFKNPMVQNSKVEGVLELQNKKIPLACQPRAEYFECKVAGGFSKGTLSLIATRLNSAASMDAKYALPLKKFKSEMKTKKPMAHH